MLVLVLVAALNSDVQFNISNPRNRLFEIRHRSYTLVLNMPLIYVNSNMIWIIQFTMIQQPTKIQLMSTIRSRV